MRRLALCAGWLVLLSCPVARAARTPAPEPAASALRSLLDAANVDLPQEPPAPKARRVSAPDIVESDARIHYECEASPYGTGASSFVLLAHGQACRACAGSGQACTFVCHEFVSGQRLPTPFSHGYCN